MKRYLSLVLVFLMLFSNFALAVDEVSDLYGDEIQTQSPSYTIEQKAVAIYGKVDGDEVKDWQVGDTVNMIIKITYNGEKEIDSPRDIEFSLMDTMQIDDRTGVTKFSDIYFENGVTKVFKGSFTATTTPTMTNEVKVTEYVSSDAYSNYGEELEMKNSYIVNVTEKEKYSINLQKNIVKNINGEDKVIDYAKVNDIVYFDYIITNNSSLDVEGYELTDINKKLDGSVQTNYSGKIIGLIKAGEFTTLRKGPFTITEEDIISNLYATSASAILVKGEDLIDAEGASDTTKADLDIARLEVTKRVVNEANEDKTNWLPGDNVGFEIIVTNSGKVAFDEIIITDEQVSILNQTYGWLAPGDNLVISPTYSAPMVNSDKEFINKVSVLANVYDEFMESEESETEEIYNDLEMGELILSLQAEAQVSFMVGPKISFDKIAVVSESNPVEKANWKKGDIVTYKFTVTNHTQETFDKVLLLDDKLGFDADSQYDLGPLLADESKPIVKYFTYQANVTPSITNNAMISVYYYYSDYNELSETPDDMETSMYNEMLGQYKDYYTINVESTSSPKKTYYKLDLGTTEGGSYGVDEGINSFKKGKLVPVVYTTDEGYKFVGYSDDSDDEDITGDQNIYMNSNKKLFAIFEKIVEPTPTPTPTPQPTPQPTPIPTPSPTSGPEIILNDEVVAEDLPATGGVPMEATVLFGLGILGAGNILRKKK